MSFHAVEGFSSSFFYFIFMSQLLPNEYEKSPLKIFFQHDRNLRDQKWILQGDHCQPSNKMVRINLNG